MARIRKITNTRFLQTRVLQTRLLQTRYRGHLLRALQRTKNALHALPRQGWSQLLAHREGLQLTIVTSAAISSAWAIGSQWDSADALVAAIITLITLRVSLQAALGEGLTQILGTAVGVSVAFLSLSLLGDNLASVALVSLVAITLARILHLGEYGGIAIGVTSLIVLGPGMATDTAQTRVVGTMLGVLIGCAFSYLAHPDTPTERTQRALAALGTAASDLLERLAHGVGASNGALNKEAAGLWLEEARALADQVPALRAQAEEAVRYARWSPTVSRADAEAVAGRVLALEHTLIQVRIIARSFYDAALAQVHLTSQVSDALQGALSGASDAVESTSDIVASDPHALTPEESVHALAAESDELRQELRDLHDTGVLLLSASVLTGVERIAESLDLENPALNEVGTPALTSSTAQDFVQAVRAPARRLRGSRGKGRNKGQSKGRGRQKNKRRD
jgi:uncharacterized membrane protein YgaE (UPF0421/DUF939 family)